MARSVTAIRSKIMKRISKSKSKSRSRKTSRRRTAQRGGDIGARGIPTAAVLANPTPLDTPEGGYTNDI
jgi:hypothetical protein